MYIIEDLVSKLIDISGPVGSALAEVLQMIFVYFISKTSFVWSCVAGTFTLVVITCKLVYNGGNKITKYVVDTIHN